MTEQPKFQRRKRRISEVEAAPQAPTRPSPQSTSERAALKALLAEKEALLQRKAELETQRLRAEVEAAEAKLKTAAASKSAPPAQEPTAKPTPKSAAEQEVAAQPKVAETPAPVAEVTDAPAEPKPKPKAKPQKPLVLAKAPEPKPSAPPRHDPEAVWKQIDRFELDPKGLARRNVITALRDNAAHARFDILRTRMLQALAENGWRRVAITSPTKDCGKTFTSANLAMSLSRQENCKTVLLDLDMRSPSLHKIFGVTDPGVIGDLLRDEIAPEHHLQGFAPNAISAGSHVAIGFNGLVEPYASELLQDPSTERVLKDIETKFDPDVMLFDLPPALLNDDVLAMRPHIDALLIVAAGGMTKASDIKETERRLGDKIPLLGVVLNKAEDVEASEYAY
ncbi:P-loop NTPase [Marivita sp. S6314]|uniref:CpsD/CapB family tyrosine-protein kinase n=1 Tax=Marivita sp. S6314 TaxID=2926406 RepID=UPI001FF50FEC|nr:P-loop NTPase [Marivita sp. S6314]MCK0151697.1 P-loop NTPase [Marivita sp. S6314]